ncbi:MAG: contact-dependent growth inhibition system immunity protein [Candidatus Dormibacteria bacterium]
MAAPPVTDLDSVIDSVDERFPNLFQLVAGYMGIEFRSAGSVEAAVRRFATEDSEAVGPTVAELDEVLTLGYDNAELDRLLREGFDCEVRPRRPWRDWLTDLRGELAELQPEVDGD